MNLKILLLSSGLIASMCLRAQQSDTIAFTINDVPVYKTDLQRAFDKSNKNLEVKETIDQFLPKYIDFKLNLAEAQTEKIDTTEWFLREYRNFYAMLANQFLEDTVTENMFLRNIYSHLLEDREILHVLLPYDKSEILPEDTLNLYNQALKLREELIKNDFNGEGYYSKHNMQSKSLINIEQTNGYLGWVAPFMFNYPVENAIYKLKKGEVSMPVRSGKGFHVIKVLDVRPTRGQLTIEQVLFRFPNQQPTTHQIDSVRQIAENAYKAIKTSEDYDILCEEYASMYNLGKRGCEFGTISLETKLPATFTSAAYALTKPGDISKPVMTETGYHIIRLKEVIPPSSYDFLEPQLKNQVRFSDRLLYLNQLKKDSLFAKYNVKLNNSAYNSLKEIANKISHNNLDFHLKAVKKDELLFTINDTVSYYVQDFLDYIESTTNVAYDETAIDITPIYDNSANSNLSTDILDYSFLLFSTEKVKKYAYQVLDWYYPELKKTMSNLKIDLLVYGVYHKNIWKRGSSDQTGLAEYFAKNKFKYTWRSPRYRGIVVYAKNNKVIEAVQSLAKNMKMNDIDAMESAIDRKLKSAKTAVRMEKGVWAKGDNEFVDNQIFGTDKPKPRKIYPYYTVIGQLISSPETYKDEKAQVETDYRSFLESEWIKNLHQKYSVKINNDVIKDIQ